MPYLLEGVRAGLVLALLVGPLVVLLLQMSLRRGTQAAFAAAAGIWASDLFFIIVSHYGIGELNVLSENTEFRQLIGGIGVVLLLTTAVVMWFREPPDLLAERRVPNKRSLLAAALQGFGINTFNPFTIAFWVFFTLTQVHERNLDEAAAWSIYGGILGTIVITDSVKVLAARKVRDFLRPEVLGQVQRVGALVLATFGLVLGGRVLGWV